MNPIYILLWGSILFVPQSLVKFWIGGVPLTLNFITLVLVYGAFSLQGIRAAVTVLGLSLLLAVFSNVSWMGAAMAYGILFLLIGFFSDQVFAESYLTKAISVLPFSFVNHYLMGLAYGFPETYIYGSVFFATGLTQAILDMAISFPLFIFLDLAFNPWSMLFSRKRASLTGADFYQVKNPHRKYI